MSSIDSDAVDYESSSEEVTPCNTPMSSTTTNVVRDDREEGAESSSVDRSNLKRNEAKRSSSAALLNEPTRKKRHEEGSPHGETSGSTVAVAISDVGASESAASANTMENLGREGLASADPDLVNAARNILLSLDASNCELDAVDPLEDLLFDVESESDAQVTASSGNSKLPRHLAFPAEEKDPVTGPSEGMDFAPSSWSHLWAPKPNWVRAHRGTQRAGTHALYDVSTIKDDDFVLRQNFHPKAREEFYIDLFHSMRYFDGRSKSKKSHSAEKQALFLSQAWGAFVVNFNEDAAKCISRLRDNRDKFLRHNAVGKLLAIHEECVDLGVPCGVKTTPRGCRICTSDDPQLAEEHLRGYNGVMLPRGLQDRIRELWKRESISVDSRTAAPSQEHRLGASQPVPRYLDLAGNQANERDRRAPSSLATIDRDEQVSSPRSSVGSPRSLATEELEEGRSARDSEAHPQSDQRLLDRLKYAERENEVLRLRAELSEMIAKHERLEGRLSRLEADHKLVLGILRDHGLLKRKRPTSHRGDDAL
ncbi:hypothetical protein FI667_g11665, partial [Globisporangium splendens]